MLRTQTEIEALIDKAEETNGTLHGMTYEEGIVEALMWVLYEDVENPLEGYKS
jgi:hypothetical protein